MNVLTSAEEQTLVLLDDVLHLVQLLDVVLDVRNPPRPVALRTRDPHPLRLQHPLLDPMRDHDRAVRDAVDPAESLARNAEPHTLQAVSQLYGRTPIVLAVMRDKTARARIGCAGARWVRDVEDGVDCGLVEVRGWG